MASNFYEAAVVTLLCRAYFFSLCSFFDFSTTRTVAE